ncbi:hypothetical protein D9M71_456610 [compost metagenome]
MADHHHRLVIEAGDATDDRRIIGEVAIAMQLFEIGEQVADVVQGIGTAGMAGELGNLPAGKITEDVLGQRLALLFQTGDFIVDVQSVVVADQTQLFDLGLQVGDRLFEIEEIRVHGLSVVN